VLITNLLTINLTRPSDYFPVIIWDFVALFCIYFVISVPLQYKVLLTLTLSFGSLLIWFAVRFLVVPPYESAAVVFAFVVYNYYGISVSRRNDELQRKNFVLVEELKSVSMTDALTGINNRRYFLNEFPKELERTHRYRNPLSLMIMDIDNLKQVNDRYGHATGDELIPRFSVACSANLRGVDHFSRTGGDEFAALLIQTSLEDAWVVADRIRLAIEQIVFESEDSGPIRTSASIGITEARNGDHTMDELIKTADGAMYTAKRGGGNRIEIGNPG
jgi:diguanylate cyclase (GGDEF)-like protein